MSGIREDKPTAGGKTMAIKGAKTIAEYTTMRWAIDAGGTDAEGEDVERTGSKGQAS